MAENKKIVNFPGTAKSVVWHFFGFWQIRSTVHKEEAVCKNCNKEYAYKVC